MPSTVNFIFLKFSFIYKILIAVLVVEQNLTNIVKIIFFILIKNCTHLNFLKSCKYIICTHIIFGYKKEEKLAFLFKLNNNENAEM